MTWHKNILEWFYLGQKYYIAMLKKSHDVNLVSKNTRHCKCKHNNKKMFGLAINAEETT